MAVLVILPLPILQYNYPRLLAQPDHSLTPISQCVSELISAIKLSGGHRNLLQARGLVNSNVRKRLDALTALFVYDSVERSRLPNDGASATTTAVSLAKSVQLRQPSTWDEGKSSPAVQRECDSGKSFEDPAPSIKGESPKRA
jgi:hypothetical protein